MAGTHDVAARLVEARLALDDAQTYVSAARPRSHADLETWFGAERGLDLQRLDADRAALEAAAHSAAEALASARRQSAMLAGAWDGPGAGMAADFLRRHCDSARVLVDSLLAAAAACAGLRDELWQAVEAKVTATTALAERVGAHRETWLSAAQRVLAGAPDEAAAAVVADEVAPFVDTAIGADWLHDMQSSTDAARRAYREAIARLGDWPTARFEVPGDLGPAVVPETPRTRPPEVSAPWAAGGPPGQADGGLPLPAVTAPPAAVAAPPAGLPPLMAPDPSGASDIPSRIGEALGGLSGSPGAPPMESAGLPSMEPPPLEGPEEPEEPEEPREAEDGEDEGTEGGDAEGEDTEKAEDPEEQAPETPTTSEPDPAPEATPQQEPVEIATGPTELGNEAPEPAPAPSPVPAPGPVPDCGSAPSPPPATTPCEMAADELPQVGE